MRSLAGSLAARRFSMEIVGLFALTALLLAGMGIYGVISYIVSERTHEIGIRLALGAQSDRIRAHDFASRIGAGCEWRGIWAGCAR